MDRTGAPGDSLDAARNKEVRMKGYALILVLCVALFLSTSCSDTPSEIVSVRDKAPATQKSEQQTDNIMQHAQKEQQASDEQRISKEEAVAIANKDAAKTRPSLEAFDIVACERARLWVIIYDGGGFEYVLDKDSGKILGVNEAPQKLGGTGAASSGVGNGTAISKAEAVEIAEEHFRKFLASVNDPVVEQINDYDPVACGLTQAWRVFFDYRTKPGETITTMPHAHPPNYVIDKRTGKIIFTTHPIASQAR